MKGIWLVGFSFFLFFLSYGNFPGTFIWWLAVVGLAIWVWLRSGPDQDLIGLERGIIALAIATPLVSSGPARPALGFVLCLLWFFVHSRLGYLPAPDFSWRKEISLILCGYSTLYFFFIVIKGSWWAGIGWLACLAIYALLIPGYLKAQGAVLTKFERGLAIFLLGQVLIILYFLPLPWGALVIVFGLFFVWILREFKDASLSGLWRSWVGLSRLALLCAATVFLFFISRL
jgi:hypothetical protein